MTIRTFFSSYCLDLARIMIIEDTTNRFANLFPNFTDQEDEDFKSFDKLADNVIKAWYYDRVYNRFVFTI